MIKTALTVSISHEDIQHNTYLVNHTQLGLLSSASQNTHIQTSHRPIQTIIGIKADSKDLSTGMPAQRAMLSRWQTFLPILMQRGCTELNASLAQYQLQPDLMICYDQNRLQAWIPVSFGFYLLRDGELRKLRPVNLKEPIFDPDYHEQCLYYTLQINADDFYLLLPPDLPSTFSPGEIASLLLGLQQLPAKMSELNQIARQRGYTRSITWMAIEVLRKEEDQHPDPDHTKSARGLRNWFAFRTAADNQQQNHESDSESMSGEDEDQNNSPRSLLGRLLADRNWRMGLYLAIILLVLATAFGILWATGMLGNQPSTDLTTEPSQAQPTVMATSTPTPTLRPTATPIPTEPPVMLIVSANRLNLREGPGRDAALLTTLSNGDSLEQLEEPEDDWVKVKTEDGTIGYVYAPYVDLQE